MCSFPSELLYVQQHRSICCIHLETFPTLYPKRTSQIDHGTHSHQAQILTPKIPLNIGLQEVTINQQTLLQEIKSKSHLCSNSHPRGDLSSYEKSNGAGSNQGLRPAISLAETAGKSLRQSHLPFHSVLC